MTNHTLDTTGISVSLQAILPILVLWITASLVLLGDVFLWKKDKGMNVTLSVVGLLAAGVSALYLGSTVDAGGYSGFAGSVLVDRITTWSNMALVVTGLLSVLLASSYLRSRGLERGEYYVLLLLSISGAMLMAQANDLIVLFLGLEVLSFALYVLAGFARTDARSEEAGLKYFLLGAFASAFLLYGIALVYGATQHTNLEMITSTLQGSMVRGAGMGQNPMLLAGIGLLIVGLGFKAAVIPFHQWTPDVYEGAPTSVTAYMAAAAKIGAFAAILRVFGALIPVSALWITAIQALAILTMVVGNLLAVTQTNVKRLLAYSSIAHAGYLLVAVACLAAGPNAAATLRAQGLAVDGALFYLFAYTFMTLGAFGVLIYLSGTGRDVQQIGDLRGLARQRPGAAYAMLFFMLSLGGIPPTMGFMGKWFVFLAAVSAGQIALAVVMGLSSVIAVFYYLRIVYMMTFEEPVDAEAPRARATGGAAASLAISALATLIFGVFPGLLHYLMNVASALTGKTP
jgi:NADH-quinone oxidoreductase subunit N